MTMTSLRQARDSGTIDQFIAEHESEVGDADRLNATVAAMARTSKPEPETSSPAHGDG